MRKVDFTLILIVIMVVTLSIIASGDNKKRVEIDGFSAHRLNIKNDQFIVYFSAEAGKLSATYTGDANFGVIRISRDRSNQNNTYVLERGRTELLPFTYGNGRYTIEFGEYDGKTDIRIVGESYSINISLMDRTAPFIGVSYYVNTGYEVYRIRDKLKVEDTQEFIKNTFNYVLDNIEYDDRLARIVEDGLIKFHRTNTETLLKYRKGICIDKSSLMVAILRSGGVPSRIMVGYNDVNQYHAWVEVFHRGRWLLYDPTLGRTFEDSVTRSYRIVRIL